MNSDDTTLDAWLQAIVAVGHDAEVIAQTMAEDGYDRGRAHLLAAAAWLRHTDVPLTQLLSHPGGREALGQLRRYLGEAVAEAHALPAVSATEGLLDPTRLHANRIELSDRSVAVHLIAHHPRLVVLADLFSGAECDALIELARHRLRPDGLVDDETYQHIVDTQVRSSQGSAFPVGFNDLLTRLDRRVSELVGWPSARRQPVAVSRYQPGQQFHPHVDFHDPLPPGHGQRLATLVVYLSEVDAGGATTFPELGVEVRPRKGGAVYFAYGHPDGSCEPASLHSGAPVLQGEKWIASYWFIDRDFKPAAQRAAADADAPRTPVPEPADG